MSHKQTNANKFFKDQHETLESQDAQNYPNQNQVNNQQGNTYQNQTRGNHWNYQQTQGNNWNHQGTQGNSWNNQGQGRTWYNDPQTRIMRIIRTKTMEGDSKELVSSIGREETRQKTVGIIQKMHI